MAERDRVWASASELERADADLVRCACLPWWGVACLSGRSVGCLPRHGLLAALRSAGSYATPPHLFPVCTSMTLYVGQQGVLVSTYSQGLLSEKPLALGT